MKEIILLCSVIAVTAAQSGVCSWTQATTYLTSYYVTTSYYYSYSCGFWGLSRCSGTTYGSSIQYRSDTTYNIVQECCSGYHDPNGGIDCEPYCEDCDSNHICIAPYTCVCPTGWTGDDCMKDINECLNGTSGCEDACINNNGSYTCDCGEDFILGLDLHSCIGPPQNVSLTAHSSTSLHLDWVEPELDYWNGIVDSYGINCTSDFGFYYYADINGVTVDHDVYDLKPFSYYTCCVHAMTTNGDSAPSCDTGKTLENVPDDVPQNITVHNYSAHAVFIDWLSPAVPNGIITLYTIYADYNNGSNHTFTVNGNEHGYILDGLSPYQLISINISASTLIGEGPVSRAVSEYTSQSVPSEVTQLYVLGLSPIDLFISWNLPEYLNGILTGFKIVVYNRVYNYSISLFVPENMSNITLSEIIEPFIPYTIEISAYTQAGEGSPVQAISFTKEGVPSVEPNITMIERQDGTSFHLTWDAPTQEELRGFLDSYIVVYEEKNTYKCLDLDPTTSTVEYVYEPFILISGLNPGKEYCVEVAAQTTAGVGNFTKFTIPLYTNLLFQLNFFSVHNCPKWVHNNSLEKIEDFIDGISLELSKTCMCHIPEDHFADERLICEPENVDKVVFQGRLVVTKDKNSTELLENMKEWVVTDPHLVIQGVQLEIDQYCSVELAELGDAKCISTTTPPITRASEEPTRGNGTESDNTTEQSSKRMDSVHVPIVALGGGIAGVVFLVLVIVFATVCIAVRCTKANKRHIIEEPPFSLPKYFGERAIDNPLYTDPVKSTGGLPAYDELEEAKEHT